MSGGVHRLTHAGRSRDRRDRFAPEGVKAKSNPVNPQRLSLLAQKVMIDVSVIPTNAPCRFDTEHKIAVVTRPDRGYAAREREKIRNLRLSCPLEDRTSSRSWPDIEEEWSTSDLAFSREIALGSKMRQVRQVHYLLCVSRPNTKAGSQNCTLWLFSFSYKSRTIQLSKELASEIGRRSLRSRFMSETI